VTGHYFDAEPAAASQRRTVPLVLPDGRADLLTDRAVFSGDRIDPGTKYLLLEAPAPGDGVTEALDLFAKKTPDVLISDVAMPGGDGYELIRRVRAFSREEGGDVPAAAITAYARPEDRSRLLNAGFSIHLPKPVDPAEVLAVVSTLTRFTHRRETPVTPES
jgi:CheY-like chemotaxis protein